MNDTPLLQVKELKKYFPIYRGLLRRQVGWIKAVDGIDFSIPSHSVLGMVGESGSGKSTAARSVIRLIEPTEGRITFAGKDVLSFDREQLKSFRKEVQIVFQDPYSSLNPRKKIRESIGEPLRYHQLVSNPHELEKQVVDVLAQVGLNPDYLERYPHELSGGQQQRVCIARAMILKPKLIICDEAVSSLDVSVQSQILNLLRDLKEQFGLSYLFVSHDLSVVRYIANNIIVFYQGRIVESGSTEEIFASPTHEYTQKLLKAIPVSHPNRR